MILLIGCLGVSAITATIIIGTTVIAVGGAITTGVLTYQNGQAQEAAAARARDQQAAFHVKQLRMQKADKARQKLITVENLKKAQTAVANSIAFQDLLANKSIREGNRLRRDNAFSGAGVGGITSPKPNKTYFYGNSH